MNTTSSFTRHDRLLASSTVTLILCGFVLWCLTGSAFLLIMATVVNGGLALVFLSSDRVVARLQAWVKAH